MDRDTLINVGGVRKKFCRSLKRSLWYGVQDLGKELFASSEHHRKLRKKEFWAVDSVSFDVRRGETLGLIGHNGAGKTTLLRMLSGLIKPDQGRIEVRGRLQALIALGAGFHPLLTGRENIYLNASILGIGNKDIERRFDRIVEFAGIREYLDMPVQNYSSGMAVRLGFSVAAHLDPDILLVDEVLSVGDLAFRTKCQLRIQEMKQNGAAIIVVSHNLHTISHICTRALTLDRGRVLFDGNTERAIDVYRDSLIARNEDVRDHLRAGTGEIRVRQLELIDGAGHQPEEFSLGEPVTLRVHYSAIEPVRSPVFNISIHVLHGNQVTGIRNDVDGVQAGTIEGDGTVDVVVPELNLLPGVYTLDVALFHSDGFTFFDRVNNAATLKVRGGLQVNGTTYLPHRWSLDDSKEIASANTPDSDVHLSRQ